MTATLLKSKSQAGGVELLERVAADGRIDRKAGIIRNVRILGRISKNGREYSDAALRQVADLCEGCAVFTNHPSKRDLHNQRPFEEHIGEIRDTSVDGGGVRGDFHYVKSHTLAEQIVERAERFPKKVGFSINAHGQSTKRNGREIVESVDDVRSVDLVWNPATSDSLFESTREPAFYMPSGAALAAALRNPNRDPLFESYADEDFEDKPRETVTISRARSKTEEGFRDAVNRVLEDETITVAQKLTKIKKLLTAQEEAGDAISDAGAADSQSEAVVESVANILTKLDALESRQRDRHEGRTSAPSRWKHEDEDRMYDNLARRKRELASNRRISFSESRRDRHDDDDLELPADSSSLARACR